MIRVPFTLIFASLISLGCSHMPDSKLLLDEKFHDLDNWHLEGQKQAINISAPGQLRLACVSTMGQVGAMTFCKQDFPDNICIEYDLIVENHNGLLITFVAMQGVHGEDAITGVPERSGVFEDYVGENASTRSYHVSVCRYMDDGVHSGVSNWRRNPGLHLMVSGRDLCTEINKPYHVKICKQGPHCWVDVNGERGAEFTDPQTLPGPIPTVGKFGFRAIGAKAFFRISNVRVTRL